MGAEPLRLSALAALVGGTVVPAGEGREDDPLVTSVVHDSRSATAGSVFVAIPGFSNDGHAFAKAAVAGGAVAVAVERPLPAPVPQLMVPSGRAVLGPMAAAVAGNPSERLRGGRGDRDQRQDDSDLSARCDRKRRGEKERDHRHHRRLDHGSPGQTGEDDPGGR